jgi:hypothetical protein
MVAGREGGGCFWHLFTAYGLEIFLALGSGSFKFIAPSFCYGREAVGIRVNFWIADPPLLQQNCYGLSGEGPNEQKKVLKKGERIV